MGIALLQMAVFIENTEAKARDSDGDGISDVGKCHVFKINVSQFSNPGKKYNFGKVTLI